jgi:ribosomal protein S12 methylthiotransferase accessory factor
MTRASRAALEKVAQVVGAPSPIASPSRSFRLSVLRVIGAGNRETIVSGRGLTRAAADIRCLGEAAEFLSLCWDGAAWEMPAKPHSGTLRPSDILCADADPPRGPDGDLQLAPVLPLNGGPANWVPATLVYYGHPDGTRWPTLELADSNGAAAGPTLGLAIRAALFELIERDAVAIWWYNRVRRPPVDRGARDHPAIHRLAADLVVRERFLLLIDLTHDLGVPVVAAVSAKNDGSSIVIGTAAAAAVRDAVIGAAGELVQILSGLGGAVPATGIGEREARVLDWLRNATLQDSLHLIPSKEAVSPPPTHRAGLKSLLKRLQARGLHVYGHDASRTALGIPVVKLFAPGLRHTKPRFGPGRLFDVPVALGWRSGPLGPGDLNRSPWPF